MLRSAPRMSVASRETRERLSGHRLALPATFEPGVRIRSGVVEDPFRALREPRAPRARTRGAEQGEFWKGRPPRAEADGSNAGPQCPVPAPVPAAPSESARGLGDAWCAPSLLQRFSHCSGHASPVHGRICDTVGARCDGLDAGHVAGWRHEPRNGCPPPPRGGHLFRLRLMHIAAPADMPSSAAWSEPAARDRAWRRRPDAEDPPALTSVGCV